MGKHIKFYNVYYSTYEGTEIFLGSISTAEMWKVSLLYLKRFPPPDNRVIDKDYCNMVSKKVFVPAVPRKWFGLTLKLTLYTLCVYIYPSGFNQLIRTILEVQIVP